MGPNQDPDKDKVRHPESPELREQGLDSLYLSVVNYEAAENRADKDFLKHLNDLLSKGIIDDCIYAQSNLHPLCKLALFEYEKEFKDRIFVDEEFGEKQDQALVRYFELVIEQMRSYLSIQEELREDIFGTDQGEFKADVHRIIEKLDKDQISVVDAVEALVNPKFYKNNIFNPDNEVFDKLLGS